MFIPLVFEKFPEIIDRKIEFDKLAYFDLF